MAVLASVDVCVTDHVGFRVIDGQMAVNPVIFVDFGVDAILIRTQDDGSIAIRGDVLVDTLQIVPNEKAHPPIGTTDERQDGRFVSLEASASLFESPRSRGLSCSSPFSPAVA